MGSKFEFESATHSWSVAARAVREANSSTHVSCAARKRGDGAVVQVDTAVTFDVLRCAFEFVSCLCVLRTTELFCSRDASVHQADPLMSIDGHFSSILPSGCAPSRRTLPSLQRLLATPMKSAAGMLAVNGASSVGAVAVSIGLPPPRGTQRTCAAPKRARIPTRTKPDISRTPDADVEREKRQVNGEQPGSARSQRRRKMGKESGKEQKIIRP